MKNIIKYNLFESFAYKNGCIMLELPISTSTRDNGLISSSMSKVGPALGINMSGYHDALTDCRITIEMYKRIVDLLNQYNNIDISKYQTERIKSIRTK